MYRQVRIINRGYLLESRVSRNMNRVEQVKVDLVKVDLDL